MTDRCPRCGAVGQGGRYLCGGPERPCSDSTDAAIRALLAAGHDPVISRSRSEVMRARQETKKEELCTRKNCRKPIAAVVAVT